MYYCHASLLQYHRRYFHRYYFLCFPEPGLRKRKKSLPCRLCVGGTVYFKIYFDNLEGTYFDYIYVEIKNEEGIIICEGLMNELSKDNVDSKDDPLCVLEKRDFEISIIFLEEAGNEYQDEKIDFELIVMATQTKNNPNRDFD